jgi:hypothetical protein
MPSLEFRKRIVSYISVGFFIGVVIILIIYCIIGFENFSKNNAVTIFSSVIEGMSALLSVAIAVIIFRIQSLENRNQSLEQSTLNYILQVVGWSYPSWISSTERDIRNKSITERYLSSMRAKRTQAISLPISQVEEKFFAEERDRQQERLEEILNLHTNIAKTIERIKNRFYTSAVFLILPILSSLLLLMVSDVLNNYWNFFFVFVVVGMSALGITLLIAIVLESTVKAK